MLYEYMWMWLVFFHLETFSLSLTLFDVVYDVILNDEIRFDKMVTKQVKIKWCVCYPRE